MLINPQNAIAHVNTSTPKLTDGSSQPLQLTSDQLNPLPKTEKEAFTQFVGETFYSILVKQMREGTGKSSLFGDSSATRAYEQQFDTMMVQSLARKDASGLSSAMYELHKLGRAN